MRQLFGKRGTARKELQAFGPWLKVLREPWDHAQVEALAAGIATQTASQRYRINAVNREINRYRYRPEPAGRDWWKNPECFFADRGGDCEDFQIAKYFTLLALGLAAETLELVVVLDILKRCHHAILAVHTDDGVLILDNQLKRVLPQDKVTIYQPRHGLQADRWWRYER